MSFVPVQKIGMTGNLRERLRIDIRQLVLEVGRLGIEIVHIPEWVCLSDFRFGTPDAQPFPAPSNQDFGTDGGVGVLTELADPAKASVFHPELMCTAASGFFWRSEADHLAHLIAQPIRGSNWGLCETLRQAFDLVVSEISFIVGLAWIVIFIRNDGLVSVVRACGQIIQPRFDSNSVALGVYDLRAVLDHRRDRVVVESPVVGHVPF